MFRSFRRPIVAACSLPVAPRTTHYQRWQRERDRRRGESRRGTKWFSGTTTLLGVSWVTTVKDVLGLEKAVMDKDPIIDKIKTSWLNRKYGRYEEAVSILHLALEEAHERKEEMAITRVLDELANTYYEKGDTQQAEDVFREVIKRLTSLHSVRDSDPPFIAISLKMADLLARRGELDNAETGYQHCVRKQMKAVDDHLAKHTVARGALIEERHPIDTRGAAHSDPFALFGMALEGYAHFLVAYRAEERQAEAEEYFSEVMKISYQIYGGTSEHSVYTLFNFGTACLVRNRFASAARFFAIAAERGALVAECTSLLPALYCNYAEALFHTGKKEEAYEWAKRAHVLSRTQDEETRKKAETFLRQLEKDLGKRKRFYFF